MASTAAYNDKSAPVYSPVSAHRAAPSAPAYDPDMAAANDIPYAVQVDAAPPQPPATFTVVHLPPALSVQPPPHVVTQATMNDWRVGLCGCCAVPAHCCLAFFFPCVNAGYAAHWIGRSGVLVALFFFITYTGCVLLSSGPSADGKSWFTYDSYDSADTAYTKWDGFATICALAFVVATTALRRAVRTFDRIPGSTINDVCASFWCSCCVLSQLSSHTERMKPHRSASASTLPAYRAA